jgi:hypothetical protein
MTSDLRRLDESARLITRRVPGSTTLRVEQLLAEARALVALDVEHDSQIDGFPTRTPGSGSIGGGAGRTVTVPDETGSPDHVPITSVEAAYLARLDRGRDQLHDIAISVRVRVERIADELRGLQSDLVRAGNIRATEGLEANQPYCYVAKHVHRLPFDAEWEPAKQTQFSGVIDRPWPEPQWVCRWVYDFTRSNRRLPTSDEMLKHLAGERVMVKTGGGAR